MTDQQRGQQLNQAGAAAVPPPATEVPPPPPVPVRVSATYAEAVELYEERREAAAAGSQAVAKLLEQIDPHGARLGLATTRQLLQELEARRITAPSQYEAQRLADAAGGLLSDLTPAALDYRTAPPA